MFDRINKGLWWDRALTLVEGCTPVSEGCDNCWSAAMKNRFMINKLGSDFVDNKGKFNGKIYCHNDRLELPLKVKKPTVWAVWNDLFHDDVPFDFILKTFEMIGGAHHHIFIILTKRPENALSALTTLKPFLETPGRIDLEFWRHVWIGVTAENQEQADKRIPILLRIPAAVRFVSVEPMLGPVDLTKWLVEYKRDNCSYFTAVPGSHRFEKLNWVICGCESGPRRRKAKWEWIESLKDQCKASQMPYFLKQGELGGRVVKAPDPNMLEIPSVNL